MNETKTTGKVYGLSKVEEEKQLKAIIEVAQENLDRTKRYSAELSEELKDMLESYETRDKEILALWHNTESRFQESKRDLMRCLKARNKPYFGRIDFKDTGLKKEESYYIGRVGISKNSLEPMVIDWRAPVASVYYENSIGLCSYEVKNAGMYKIDLTRKRTYEITNDKLIDFYDSDVVANDELLTKYLAKSKKAVLGEIIGTIQKEQNTIIRKSPKNNLLVQGVAGSGKTTVAMHRISYILYNYEMFRPQDFYIIGSNRILLNYITSVLPDLDVYGVSQMTMEQLFIRLLYEDWEPKRQKVGALNKRDELACIKGSYAWFHDLEDFCSTYEKRVIPMEDVIVDKTGVVLLGKTRIESFVKESTKLSMQGKINGLTELLLSKLENELVGKYVTYTPEEKKDLQRACLYHFGRDEWKGSIYEVYHEFLEAQKTKGINIEIKNDTYDVYDLAALAYIYKRIKEIDGIREASHIIIDEAQDFGMMAYGVLYYCLRECTYTIMGDVSQNIYYGYGLNDWEELKKLILTGTYDSFGLLKKSYRNTVEISNFATEILRHGNFPIYPVEPIIRHGNQVRVFSCETEEKMIQKAADTIIGWQKNGYETIAVICHDEAEAVIVHQRLKGKLTLTDANLETAKFEQGVMVLPVEYSKGLEFDAVLIYHPSKENYPEKDQYVKLLYVAATRALHELAVIHMGDMTELIAKPVSEEKRMKLLENANEPKKMEYQKKVEFDNTAKYQEDLNRYCERTRHNHADLLIKDISQIDSSKKQTTTKKTITASVHQFMDVPNNSMLFPKGHSRIDNSIRWVKRTKSFMDMVSNYGVLRITPLEDTIIRIQFQKGQTATFMPGYWNYVPDKQPAWGARENHTYFEITTGHIILRIEKKTGAIHFFDNKGKQLLMEKSTIQRQMEMEKELPQTWNYFDWAKNEKLSAKGVLDDSLERMEQKARFISICGKNMHMPLLVSDRGYGLGIAAEGTVMCCNISMYGPYVYTEGTNQIDYYFMYGGAYNNTLELYKKITQKDYQK